MSFEGNTNMKSVFVVWKDSADGMWHPVAKLSRVTEGYRFNYTKGARNDNFIAFPRMDDLLGVYHSSTLFSFFSNRLIPTNRPEFRMMLDWSDIDFNEYDELDLLGVSGGARTTDEFRIVSEPSYESDGKYKIKFFLSGVRYLDREGLARVQKLRAGEELSLIYEDKNEYDCNAILVTSSDEIKIGYCPKYFNCDIRALLQTPELSSYSLKVLKVNNDAPDQFKILCEFTTRWPIGFKPMISDEYIANTNC